MGGGAASSTASRLASTSPGRGRTPAVVCNGLVQMTPPLHSTIDDTLDYCGPASPWRGGRVDAHSQSLAVTGTRACPPLPPPHADEAARGAVGGQSVGSGHAHPRSPSRLPTPPPPALCCLFCCCCYKVCSERRAADSGCCWQQAAQPALHRGGPPILEMATTTTTAF